MIRALINRMRPNWRELPQTWRPNPATVGHIAREIHARRAEVERTAAILGGAK
jgi:hypothetical protein